MFSLPFRPRRTRDRSCSSETLPVLTPTASRVASTNRAQAFWWCPQRVHLLPVFIFAVTPASSPPPIKRQPDSHATPAGHRCRFSIKCRGQRLRSFEPNATRHQNTNRGWAPPFWPRTGPLRLLVMGRIPPSPPMPPLIPSRPCQMGPLLPCTSLPRHSWVYAFRTLVVTPLPVAPLGYDSLFGSRLSSNDRAWGCHQRANEQRAKNKVANIAQKNGQEVHASNKPDSSHFMALCASGKRHP